MSGAGYDPLMWLENIGGGTSNPMIWVHAGPAGAHPMGFHVTQEVWNYVAEHGLKLAYHRTFIQGQLDGIAALLQGPAVQESVSTVQSVAKQAPLRRHLPLRLGWALGVVGVTAVGVWVSRARGAAGAGD